MSGLLRDEDWEILVRRIRAGKCTPFLGAGACFGVLPLGGDIAKQWAEQYEYPFEDKSNLITVAQFLALKRDPMFPKDELVRMWKKFPSPDFEDPTEPHRMLAGLPIPVYITTNYDDFMFKALSGIKRSKTMSWTTQPSSIRIQVSNRRLQTLLSFIFMDTSRTQSPWF